MTTCPLCQGPHELSQCPRWKQRGVVLPYLLGVVSGLAIAYFGFGIAMIFKVGT